MGCWGLNLKGAYGGFWKVLMNKGPSGGDLALCACGAAPAGARRGSRGAGSLPAVRPLEHRVSGEFWAGVCGKGARFPHGPWGWAPDAGGLPPLNFCPQRRPGYPRRLGHGPSAWPCGLGQGCGSRNPS